MLVFSQALERFEHDYPEKEMLVISRWRRMPCCSERVLSYRDRIHLLRAGYMSVGDDGAGSVRGAVRTICSLRSCRVARQIREERLEVAFAGLDPTGAVTVPARAQAAAAPACIGAVGVAWRKGEVVEGEERTPMATRGPL